MPVWSPPPGLPECEWTLVNKTQTYTDAPAAIGLSGGKSVWATSNNNNNKASCMPGFLFFTPLPITRRRCHRRGPWKDGSLTKNRPVRGSLLAPARPQWMGVRDHLQLTPTPKAGRSQKGRLRISISNPNATKASKGLHWFMLKCSYGWNFCLANSLVSLNKHRRLYDRFNDQRVNGAGIFTAQICDLVCTYVDVTFLVVYTAIRTTLNESLPLVKGQSSHWQLSKWLSKSALPAYKMPKEKDGH